MQGQIFKIHSDFYYVETQNGVVECKVTGVLKKRKDNIVVGDFVDVKTPKGEKSYEILDVQFI